MERMPMRRPSSSTTGRWRFWWLIMTAVASAMEVERVAMRTGVVMTSVMGICVRVAAAEGDAGHDVALGEDPGDDAVFIDHGGGAHAALDHGLDGVGGSGNERDGGGIGGAIIENAHNQECSRRAHP